MPVKTTAIEDENYSMEFMLHAISVWQTHSVTAGECVKGA